MGVDKNVDGSMSRRTFLGVTAAGVVAPWVASAETANPGAADRVGVQLYTVRQALQEKPAETLQAIAEIGYRHVESFDVGALDRLAPLLEDAGLKVTSTHVNPSFVTGNWAVWEKRGAAPPPFGKDVDAVVDVVGKHGIEFAVFPYLLPEERGSLDDYKSLAGKLNTAGEKCKAAGIQLGYHNHAFELVVQDGKTPFDVLVAELDKALVQFEIDVFWVAAAGHDPVELLRAHAEHCRLLHLKDLKAGIEPSPGINPPPEAFEELGDGVVDFPAVLAVAAEIGIRHCYVEQDQTPGDAVASLRQSMAYLRGLQGKG